MLHWIYVLIFDKGEGMHLRVPISMTTHVFQTVLLYYLVSSSVMLFAWVAFLKSQTCIWAKSNSL